MWPLWFRNIIGLKKKKYEIKETKRWSEGNLQFWFLKYFWDEQEKKKTKVEAANHRVSKPAAMLKLPRSNTPSHVTQLLDDGGKYRQPLPFLMQNK